MNVVTLNFNQRGIGTYRRCFYFSRELVRQGHNVTMFTVSPNSAFRSTICYKSEWTTDLAEAPASHAIKLIETPNLGYRWLPGWGSGPLDILHRTYNLALSAYDVVIGFEYQPNVSWPVYFTRPFTNYLFVSDWCDWFAGQSNHFRGIKFAHRVDAYWEEKIRKTASRLSVTSEVLHRRALELGIHKNSVVQIPEGAATDYVVPMDMATARGRLGLPSDSIIVGAMREGDMEREVRIFSKIQKRCPNARLLLLGKIALRAVELARELGIERHVLSSGWASNIDYPVYLSAADIWICPLENTLTNRARWPAKILDFLSAGRPVVTSPVGEVAKLFESRNIGSLAEPDSDAFVEAVVMLIKNKDLRFQLGNTARQVMTEEWDWRHRGVLINSLVGS